MINYGVSGNDRKRLVKALESHIGERSVYLGMPSCSFRVGPYEVSKSGEITDGELSDEIKDGLIRAGFIPVDEEVEEEEPTGIVISVPLDSVSDDTVQNFENMVSSKGELIKAAFGLTELPIERTDDTLQILWFRSKEPENREYAEKFVSAMLDKASHQRYMSPKLLETSNERYSFRVFLNSLNFTGSEHKALRAELLKNLPGNSAWRNGKPERRTTN